MLIRASPSVQEVQRSPPSWGLWRISQKTRNPVDNDYHYDSSGGEGITVYVVFTGVDVDHPDLKPRAIWGYNNIDSGTADRDGYGTFYSALIAGTKYGVAKKATVIGVRSYNLIGNGIDLFPHIREGLRWAVNDATEKGISKKSVLSFHFPMGRRDGRMEALLNGAVDSGMFVVGPAGDKGENGDDFMLSHIKGACITGAFNRSNQPAPWSNWGKSVSVYAPGHYINSTLPGDKPFTMSGTMVAMSYTAGVGAYLMGLEGIPGSKVCERIKELASPCLLDPVEGTTNKLLYNGYDHFNMANAGAANSC
ncbi:Secreted subtilisin-like serine protease sub9 [Myotisia sp. PD_48]|nr:Secreted subtilisin-like serine protease sub9 [Myotisia sp. PD_48]